MSSSLPRRRLIAWSAAVATAVAPLAIIGTSASPASAATPVQIQIVATNDFHGRLADRPTGPTNPEPIEMASVMAGAVKQMRTQNPNTVFAAAGDLIGGSTFESFIQHDKPTIDALNEAGLEVSAAGNHEFDAGYDDLLKRVMAPYDAANNPEGGAHWKYLAANVRKVSDNTHALGPNTDRWIKDFGGVQVGFVGAVTEELPSLVSATAPGNDQIKVSGIVNEVNASADLLKGEGADVVVLLVHEGAATTDISTATDESAFGKIVKGANANIDAIVSGHTHLAYNHSIPVPAWVSAGRAVTERPVVSAGQYGAKLNKLTFTVDPDPDNNPATNDAAVTAKSQAIVDLFGADPDGSSGPKATPPLFPVDAATKSIVDAAFAKADVLGAVKVGSLAGPARRAVLASGGENRGGESSLGNLVAEVQRWATQTPEAGAAQIAFMNPGGLRADMIGSTTSTYPADLTYKQVAVVQPFANTLVNMRMTGAQLKKVLEEQWQRDKDNKVPSRPFLRLGTSAGFTSTFDLTRPEGDRITGMWLNGDKINPADTAKTYSVTANSFLAAGGDNFWEFKNATAKRDTGRVDLQSMVDYAAEKSPVAVSKTQHQVGVSFPSTAPTAYRPGERVRLSLSSLSFSTAGDTKDSQLSVQLGNEKLGTASVDNTVGATPFDETGKSEVDVALPTTVAAGPATLTLTGNQTGTVVRVPLTIQGASPRANSTVTAAATPSTVSQHTGTSTVSVSVTVPNATASGSVAALLDGQVIGGGLLTGGKADILVGPFTTSGSKTLTISYSGDAANLPASTSLSLTVTPQPSVTKSEATLSATIAPAALVVRQTASTASVTVAKASGVATGTVLAVLGSQVVGAGELKDGKAAITLLPFATSGAQQLTLSYLGDDATKPANSTLAVNVVKAKPTLKIAGSKKVRVKKKATFNITVSAQDIVPTGQVKLAGKGFKAVTKSLTNGSATLKVRMKKAGKTKVTISYLGDSLTAPITEAVTVRVTKRRTKRR